jgi:hypothetical protein
MNRLIAPGVVIHCKYSVLEFLVRFSRSARILTVTGWFCQPAQLRLGSTNRAYRYEVLAETASS